MKKRTLFTILTFFLLPLSAFSLTIDVGVEGGAAFSGYNDVRIPGDEGTKLSLTDELSTEPAPALRVELLTTIFSRHDIKLLAAPLRLSAEGTLEKDVRFTDQVFTKGTKVKAKYRFDSYRLTYRYNFYKTEKLQIGIGVTGKIRDAETSLENHDKKGKKTNTGFVPLLNFKLNWKFNEPFSLLIEADGLIAPQGRAEDALIALNYHPVDFMTVKIGYRILEGGADNDTVYTFTLIHYAVAGLNFRWGF